MSKPQEQGEGTQKHEKKGVDLMMSKTKGWKWKPQELGEGTQNPKNKWMESKTPKIGRWNLEL